jgi:hypothetical protein
MSFSITRVLGAILEGIVENCEFLLTPENCPWFRLDGCILLRRGGARLSLEDLWEGPAVVSTWLVKLANGLSVVTIESLQIVVIAELAKAAE